MTVEEHLTRAFHLHRAGRLEDAEPVYRAILKDQPQHPHALHLLGLVCHQTGRQEEALALISQAIDVFGPHPEFHCNLAAVYQATGRTDLAETHCRQALQLRPDYPEAHNNLGIALRDQGKDEEAEAEFRAATSVNPQYADAFWNLGVLLNARGEQTDALTPLIEAVRLAPNNAMARISLGAVLLALGQTEESSKQLNEAIRIAPNATRAYTTLGAVWERLPNNWDVPVRNALENPTFRPAASERVSPHELAARYYRKALEIEPDDVEAHNKLGMLLLNQGQTADALVEFQATLKHDPGNSMAYLNIGKMVSSGFHQLSDEEIQNLRTLAEQPKMTVESRGRLHYALAQVFDKKGSYDEAFAHLETANELKQQWQLKRAVTFDPLAHAERVDQLIAAFTPAYFERVRSFGIASELPVFIVGMPRSGTSLTEQILASHPRVHGAGELSELDGFAATLPERLGAEDVGYPACMARLDAPTARMLGRAHVNELQKMKPDALRVTDKAPLNFFHVGIIVSVFPRARIIHCRRNPVDTCLSCYFQNFAEAFAFTHDQKSLGQYYREYERLMAHWDEVLPGRIYHLDYEDMTADQEGTSRKLVAHCGLEWDERCLNFHETDRTVKTFSSLQVRRPMYRSSVERWKRYEKHLHPLLEALGRR
jgi:Flp pilus assembly protein TadD